MPSAPALQASRFELKYIIDERRAGFIRDFVRGYLEPDGFADPNNGNSYRISSLYMDSPGLALYQQTVFGEKNRFKLRIRFYDNDPTHPVFLEIKRRVTDVILKERAGVTREGALKLLAGDPLSASWLFKKNGDEKAGKAMLNFRTLCDSIGAIGVIYVSYRREAYVTRENNSIRVTFDRQLLGGEYRQGSPLTLPVEGAKPEIGNGDRVILELKFTDRFPAWMHDMTQAFDLQRTSAPKYVYCINTMGIQPDFPFPTSRVAYPRWKHGEPADRQSARL